MPLAVITEEFATEPLEHLSPTRVLASKEVFHAHFDLIFGSASLDRTR